MKLLLLFVLSAVVHAGLLVFGIPGREWVDGFTLGSLRYRLTHGPGMMASALPFPASEALLALLLFGLLMALVNLGIGWSAPANRKKAGKTLVRYLGITVPALMHLFLFCFGHLYLGSQVEDRVPELRQELTAAQVREQALAFADVTARVRVPVTDRTPEDWSAAARGALAPVLSALGYPELPAIRVKSVWPAGTLMAMGVSGITNFLPPEGIVDPGLDPASLPLVVLHELLHVAGVAHEDDAEFLAFIAGSRSADPELRYSAFLCLTGRVLSCLTGADRNEFEQRLGAEVRADRARIAEAYARHRIGWLSGVAGTVHEGYLHAVGVEEGVRVYDRAAKLILAERQFDAWPRLTASRKTPQRGR